MNCDKIQQSQLSGIHVEESPCPEEKIAQDLERVPPLEMKLTEVSPTLNKLTEGSVGT